MVSSARARTGTRPGAEQWLPGRLSLRALREAVQECRGCELYQDATQAVMGDGRVSADLVLVGEQPGDQEDRRGQPFVGPAGRLLDEVLTEAGVDPARVYTTNAVKHFRFQGTRGKQRLHKSPSRVHVAACGPWLLAELALVKPRGVVLLGATAGQAVHGSGFRVGKARGSLQPWPEALPLARPPSWTLATAHPSSVLRSRERDRDRAALVADLRVAASALDQPRTPPRQETSS